jgi:hypothetical protein
MAASGQRSLPLFRPIARARPSGLLPPPGRGWLPSRRPDGSSATDSAAAGDASVRRIRLHAKAMLAVTSVYLCAELAFNASLLDVVGSAATPEQILAVDSWGKIVTGVAIALLIWGMAILPLARRLGIVGPPLFLALAAGAACGYGIATSIHNKAVEAIVEGSSAEDRRSAAVAAFVQSGTAKGVLRPAGSEGIDFSRPDGQAFLALLPYLSAPGGVVGAGQGEVFRAAVSAVVEATYPDPLSTYAAYLASHSPLRDAYRSYAAAGNAYRDAVEGLPVAREEAWGKLREASARAGVLVTAIPVSQWQRVEFEVRDRGVDVPKGWSPLDRPAFERAVDNQVFSRARGAVEAGMRAALDSPVPLGLSPDAFLRHPAVLDAWRKSLALPDDAPLRQGLTQAEWTRMVHEPALRRESEKMLSALLAPARSFSDDGPHSRLGRDAMLAYAVPPVALALSVLGAVFHAWKVGSYALVLARAGRVAKGAWFLVVAAAVAAPLMVSTPVLSSPAWAAVEAQARMRHGWGVDAAAWTVRAQSLFYPVNGAVRTWLLLGFSFGAPSRS